MLARSQYCSMLQYAGSVHLRPAQLSLPIQNRRTRAVTLSVEPREAVVEVGTGASSAGVCLPIKNRRTRGVILETAEFNPDRLVPPSLNVGRGQDASGGDMTRRAVHNPVGQSLATDSPTALVPRLPSSPAATSSARTSSVPASPSVMSRNSRVHFAASPASVVEITPYSWTSRSSACSPTSPTFDESPTRPATSLSIPQPASGASKIKQTNPSFLWFQYSVSLLEALSKFLISPWSWQCEASITVQHR